MTNPLFTDVQKAYIAQFLDDKLPHPTTPFEARAVLERAISRIDQADANGALVAASFRIWADELDPQGHAASASSLN